MSHSAEAVIRPLEEVADILDSQRVPVNRAERAARPGDVPYYGATGQVGFIDRALFNEELVLLGEDGAPFLDPHKQKAYMISGPSWVNNHAHVLRARADICTSNYLMHYLNTFAFDGFVSGTTRLKLTQASMRKIPIPLIPVDDQQSLVAEIEKQFTRLDAGENELIGARSRMDRYKASVLQSAVSGRLISASFQSVLLSSVATMRLGKMLSAASRGGLSPTPYLRNINVRWGWIDTDDLLSMDFTEREKEEFHLEIGDVLVCEGGEPGRSAVWGNQVHGTLFQKALHRVRTDRTKLLPEYLVIHLRADALTGRLSPYFTGSTIKHFTGVALKRYVIQVPDLECQERIVEEVERRLSVLDALSAQVVRDLKRVHRLRQAILSRAFAGELLQRKVA